MIRLLLDCDPGLDDAIALALAMASPELAVIGISTVACNAPITIVTANAEAVMDRLECHCPLFEGASRPLAVNARHATNIWGGDGRLPLKNPAKPASHIGHADFARLAGEADIVCATGSFTNIAGLIKEGHRLNRLVIMGGALGRGNATPHAELNIWADPHAAEIVFASGLPITVVPLDITRTLIVPKQMIAKLAASASNPGRLCGELLPHAGSNAQPSAIHDAAVIGFLLWPELFVSRRGRFAVTTSGAEEGRTLFTAGSDGPHKVLTDVARDAFFAHMQRSLCGEV